MGTVCNILEQVIPIRNLYKMLTGVHRKKNYGAELNPKTWYGIHMKKKKKKKMEMCLSKCISQQKKVFLKFKPVMVLFLH